MHPFAIQSDPARLSPTPPSPTLCNAHLHRLQQPQLPAITAALTPDLLAQVLQWLHDDNLHNARLACRAFRVACCSIFKTLTIRTSWPVDLHPLPDLSRFPKLKRLQLIGNHSERFITALARQGAALAALETLDLKEYGTRDGSGAPSALNAIARRLEALRELRLGRIHSTDTACAQLIAKLLPGLQVLEMEIAVAPFCDRLGGEWQVWSHLLLSRLTSLRLGTGHARLPVLAAPSGVRPQVAAAGRLLLLRELRGVLLQPGDASALTLAAPNLEILVAELVGDFSGAAAAAAVFTSLRRVALDACPPRVEFAQMFPNVERLVVRPHRQWQLPDLDLTGLGQLSEFFYRGYMAYLQPTPAGLSKRCWECCFPRLHRLQRLQCEVTLDDLSALARLPASLRALHVVVGCREGQERFDLARVLRAVALAPAARQLQTLVIDAPQACLIAGTLTEVLCGSCEERAMEQGQEGQEEREMEREGDLAPEGDAEEQGKGDEVRRQAQGSILPALSALLIERPVICDERVAEALSEAVRPVRALIVCSVFDAGGWVQRLLGRHRGLWQSRFREMQENIRVVDTSWTR